MKKLARFLVPVLLLAALLLGRPLGANNVHAAILASWCVLILLAFAVLALVAAIARRLHPERPSVSRGWTNAAVAAAAVLAVEIAVTVCDVRGFRQIGETAKVGERKERLEELVPPSFRRTYSPEQREANVRNGGEDCAETWWIERHFSFPSLLPNDQTWLVSFDDDGIVRSSIWGDLD